MTATLEKVTDNQDIATEVSKEQILLRNNDNLCSPLIHSYSNEKKRKLKVFSLDLVRRYTKLYLSKKGNNVSNLSKKLQCSRQTIYDFLKGEREYYDIQFILNLLEVMELTLFIGKELKDPPKNN